MSDSDIECTPPEVLVVAQASVESLLPTKSKSLYEASYQRFIKWCTERHITKYSENVLLAYFSAMASNMKSSTLWSHYSMVKSLLSLKHNVDITKYLKLRAFLKKQGENYIPKKAKVLSKGQFDNFVFNAPDEKYLGIKVVLIFGISGACRCHELYKMKIEDIEDHGSLLYIKVPETKTKKYRSFTIVGEDYLAKYRKYLSLRPADFEERKFFLKYQNGKCYRMVMGIHKLGSAAKEVASYLKLPKCNEYTGHCLRRTSATLLVDNGGDITTLKRHGGWKSNSVAESYIEESMESKKNIASKILMPSKSKDQHNSSGGSSFTVTGAGETPSTSGNAFSTSRDAPSTSRSAHTTSEIIPITSGNVVKTINLSSNLEYGTSSGFLHNANINNSSFVININKN